jgi:hypothetical protein
MEILRIGPYQSVDAIPFMTDQMSRHNSIITLYLASEGPRFVNGSLQALCFVNAPHMISRLFGQDQFIREQRHRFTPCQPFIGYSPWKLFAVSLASYPHNHEGAGRYKEIFGHQRGGPILEEATPALTKRQAEGIARDSARSIPDRNIFWNNGAYAMFAEIV